MDAHRVSEADADLPALVDRAVGGQQVLITRDGQPIAELRPCSPPTEDIGTTQWFTTRRIKIPGLARSVRRMREDDAL